MNKERKNEKRNEKKNEEATSTRKRTNKRNHLTICNAIKQDRKAKTTTSNQWKECYIVC